MQSTTFKRHEGVVCREVAGETFLVPMHGRMADLNELFVLNEVGSVVWEYLREQHSLEQVAAHLTIEFEVDEGQAFIDAGSFIGELVEAGLADQHQAEQF